jgi:SNF2 family DNA or RNA helicase
MKKEQEIVRIELTPEQKELVKKQTGKNADAVELSVRELEERIAPVAFIDGLE